MLRGSFSFHLPNADNNINLNSSTVGSFSPGRLHTANPIAMRSV
jgi:hypothetical protein